MKHARDDYSRIQDPDALIPDEEPVFLIRGQDEIAADVILDYAARARASGYPQNVVDAAVRQSWAMRQWPVKKKADIPSRKTDESREADRG
jgi:hypothetical protein